MSSLRLRRLSLVAVFAMLLALFGTALADKPASASGRCHEYRCSCPGFQGSGYTCSRGGCRHHYDRHY